jgi:hypothetical protein
MQTTENLRTALRDVVLNISRQSVINKIQRGTSGIDHTVDDMIVLLEMNGVELKVRDDYTPVNDGKASEETRRANSRAVATLNRWRVQYAELVTNIRAMKNVVKMTGLRGDHIMLKALQARATQMSADRYWIGVELKGTAYRYV